MTEGTRSLPRDKQIALIYPNMEPWTDIGHPEQHQRANATGGAVEQEL